MIKRDAYAWDDLRDCGRAIRQIESDNAEAAIARASREIQHDNYRLARALRDAGLAYPAGWFPPDTGYSEDDVLEERSKPII